EEERRWIVRFLSDRMTSTEDWKMLKCRHTWELLSSLVQSSVRDQVLWGLFLLRFEAHSLFL
ncbi:hypothetical protein BDR04DRAFT_1040162, partial [Suillus decipiens]